MTLISTRMNADADSDLPQSALESALIGGLSSKE
jgi:hypothetical protein